MIQASPTEPAKAAKLGFRADINLLRAIAVLAVIAYHFGLAPGGFVGVDVFFVISGYLMTALILARVERGTFSPAAFYLDRARRIVPALAVLIAAMLGLGALVLLPDDYALLARHSAGSAGFVSNLLYWQETGYFEPAGDRRWLLHTWSLSLEWQFYLLYPLLLAPLARLAPRALGALLAAGAVLSFALMLWLSQVSAATGFYWLPPRGWELLAGALAGLAPSLAGRRAQAAEISGYVLIAGSLALIGAAGWPDVRALAPVAGTVLVILARRTPPRPIGQGLAAWIGLASYSLYLWHWPVVVGLRHSGRDGDWRWAAAGIAATFLLGFLSWRFVERRPAAAAPHIHVGRTANPGRALFAYALAPLALVLAGLAVARTHGLPQRFPAAIQSVVREAAYVEVEGAAGCYQAGGDLPEPCRLGPRGAPLLATFLGDSHADAQLPGLIEALGPGARSAIAFNALAGCAPILGALPIEPRNACGAFNARFVAPLAQPRRAPLILAANWAGYLDEPPVRFAGEGGGRATSESFGAHLIRSSCALAAGGPVYVVLPTPLFPSGVANALQRRLLADPKAPDVALPRADHEARVRRAVALLREAGRKCGVRLLDPAPYLCSADICPGSLGHHPLYRDNHHLTRLGARRLAPMYRRVFAEAPGDPAG
jgi:peptidoglycan/LPS O-acetylase OafA/YrhL